MTDLLYFCGQSNMVGAAALPAVGEPDVKHCEEYKYSLIARGGSHGIFVPVTFDCGEFLFKDPGKAYESTDESGRSLLTNYRDNCYSTSAISNAKADGTKDTFQFTGISESNHVPSPSLAPYFCAEWEKLGCRASIANFSKGSTKIDYFTTEAAEVMKDKGKAFLREACERYGRENIGSRVFVWLQGESDQGDSTEEYKRKMKTLHQIVTGIGFDIFTVIRVGYWFSKNCSDIMRAQEDFCRENKNCYILTRTMSFMTDVCNDSDVSGWYTKMPADKYRHCRDSLDGYRNSHINARGFKIIAKRMAKNLYRILREGKKPVLEHDIVIFSGK